MAPKLTELEAKLLEYPPTPTTWLCEQHRGYVVVNRGNNDRCFACRRPRPRHPKLAMGLYRSALAKTQQGGTTSGA